MKYDTRDSFFSALILSLKFSIDLNLLLYIVPHKGG
jgi:hypothetical protein